MMRWIFFSVLLTVSCSRGTDPDRAQKGIVSLAPIPTSIICALNRCGDIVAIDEYSQKEVSPHTPMVVGSHQQIDLGAILRIRPQYVFLSRSQKQLEPALKRAGIETAFVWVDSISDLNDNIEKVGQTLGAVEQAHLLTRNIQESIKSFKNTDRKCPRVLVVLDRQKGNPAGIWAAGQGTYADELLRIVGCRNAIAGGSAKYVEVSRGDLLTANPTHILDLTHSQNHAQDWNAFPQLSAVQNKKVTGLTEHFATPHPDVARALSLLDKAIQ